MSSACIELRYNFRPLVADVHAAIDVADGRVNAHKALGRLHYTISGLRTALADAEGHLVRRRLAAVLNDAKRLHPTLSQRKLQLRLGVLSEAYSAARTACRAAAG